MTRAKRSKSRGHPDCKGKPLPGGGPQPDGPCFCGVTFNLAGVSLIGTVFLWLLSCHAKRKLSAVSVQQPHEGQEKWHRWRLLLNQQLFKRSRALTYGDDSHANPFAVFRQHHVQP